MDVSSIANSSLDIQALLGQTGGAKRTGNGYDTEDKTAYYSKKGEPMYMEDMDSDKDGVVTLDEFKEYCKSKGMNSKDMVKMSQLASSYRTMQAENETIDYISKLIPNVHPNLKQAESESSVYAKQGDSKYNAAMDTNRDNKISYQEYMAYCQKNAAPHELKADAKLEETEKGKFKITNSGKAIESYEKSEGYYPESLYEDVA